MLLHIPNSKNSNITTNIITMSLSEHCDLLFGIFIDLIKEIFYFFYFSLVIFSLEK